jgi:O-antigen ligase
MSGHGRRLLECLVAIRVLRRRSAITLLLLGIGVSTITASSGGCRWGSLGLLLFVVAVIGWRKLVTSQQRSSKGGRRKEE